MDLELSANLKTAISAWVTEAVQRLRNNNHQLAELKKCVEGDGDVRIVYSVRRNVVIIETMDFAEETFTEIFREELVPWLGGLALPETDTL